MEKSKVFKNITESKAYQKTKDLRQHGNVTVFEHSVYVASTSLKISKKLHIKVDEDSMIKCALLHDYFLYDWHDPNHPKLHGFRHASIAADNADRDFGLTKKEYKAIRSHMFPLNLRLPSSREAFILTLADKYCAATETLKTRKNRRVMKKKAFKA